MCAYRKENERWNKKFWKDIKRLLDLQYLTVLYQLHSLTTLNLVSIDTLHTIVPVVEQWAQLWDPLLQKYGFSCHSRMVWLPWFPNLTLYSPGVTAASFASASEVWTSGILERLKLRDKNLDFEVTFNGMTSLLNFKHYQLFQNLLVRSTHVRTDRFVIS
jgi:hypothetical protein